MYYVRFADLLTDADVLEVSIPFQLDRRIIQPGMFSASIPITNTAIGDQVRLIVPQRTIAHVYRGDMILGSYVIWSKTVSGSSSGITCDIQGATLESYLYRRVLPYDLTFTGTEQFEIFENLLAAAQVGYDEYPDSADLGIYVDGYMAGGITRDRTYLSSDSSYVGNLIEDLANCENGFEYVIHTWTDGVERERFAHLGYPALGSTQPPIILEQPGCVTEFSILYDGTAGSTVFQARGQTASTEAGEETVPLTSDLHFASDYLSKGFPILDKRVDKQDVTVKSTLDSYAAQWAISRGGPIVVPSFTVKPTRMFEDGFSPFSLGANVVVILNNPAFPLIDGVPMYSESSRFIGFELTLSENGNESMKVLIESNLDPEEGIA